MLYTHTTIAATRQIGVGVGSNPAPNIISNMLEIVRSRGTEEPIISNSFSISICGKN